MDVRELVEAGTRNAFRREPAVDREKVERLLRRANRKVGRPLGQVEWVESLEGYLRRVAGLMLDGWTVDDDHPLTPRERIVSAASGRLERLLGLEGEIWNDEFSAHRGNRLSRGKRLVVYLNAVEEPASAARAAVCALQAAEEAARRPEPRAREFAGYRFWKSQDAHWKHSQAVSASPFLSEIAACFASGLYAAARLRRRAAARTILIGRPCIRRRAGRLHADEEPAVLWPDASGRWYWDGILVPSHIGEARDRLTAELVARIRNQEVRRVVLDRLGWERFLQTAGAKLVAQDDFGKLWSTDVQLDSEAVQLVEVINATPEPDGSYRRYFLRVPPTTKTARAAVAWTFGFDDPSQYLIGAQS